ncbi:MAG: acyl-CoA dehydrogenase family protein [Saprospiraceae bacterium]|nr:acyl-CoA dehydrogenase family protein [Saprospiraceae bacterium]
MTTSTVTKEILQGGAFIVQESDSQEVFSPEDISEDQSMVREMTRDFVVQSRDEMQMLEHQAPMMEAAGELGLLGAHMPEQYGGMQLDACTNAFIGEEIGAHAGSFGTTFAAHTGIGMLPILYFGTPEQKQAFLPKMISGEWKGAYCLTEPSSGSDALAAKSRADLTDDGRHYRINGQKMWISNAGFADIFIVFAQVDGTDFTGFIVKADSEGISLGAEEKKLGIKGSSTRQVFFENVLVPVENLLGDLGKGHLIAFNALNTGRFKLGNMCMGGAKEACTTSIRYANERHQFKQPISQFGAIKSKIATQAISVFACESAVYRVAHLMDVHTQALKSQGHNHADAKLKAAEEVAIECAIVKILGSEVLDEVVDEMVQIHGGYGFSEEYPAARAYRDQRISRIYEGTNEINRMLIINMLFKRVMKGKVDLVGPAWAVQKELADAPSFAVPEGLFGQEKKSLSDFKKLALMVLGAAAKMQMDGKLELKNEQELMMHCADMLITIFNIESTLLRVEKNLQRGQETAPSALYEDLLATLFYEANADLTKYATDALASFAEGDLLETLLIGVRRYTSYPIVNPTVLRRSIADYLIENNKYAL